MLGQLIVKFKRTIFNSKDLHREELIDKIYKIDFENIKSFSNELFDLLNKIELNDEDLKFNYFKDLKEKLNLRSEEEVARTLNTFLDNCSKLIDQVPKFLREYCPEIISPDNITLKSISSIKLIYNLSYLESILINFNSLLSTELYILDKVSEKKAFNNTNLKNYFNQLHDFIVIKETLEDTKWNLMSYIEKVKDITLEGDEEEFRYNFKIKTINNKDLEKLKIFNKNFIGNPVYHLGIFINKLYLMYYEYKTESKKLIELKLIELKNKQSEMEDPKIQKQIEYYENKLKKIQRKLEKMES